MRILLACLLFCIALPAFTQSADFRYDNDRKAFTVTRLNPPKLKLNDEEKPRWLLFWEFGDGHYAMQKQEEIVLPVMYHNYAVAGSYTVRLYVTPLYSRDVPPCPAVVKTIEVRGRGTPQTGAYVLNREYDRDLPLNIVSNVEKEAIAKHTVRLAIHHRNPANQNADGFLVLLLNRSEEVRNLSFEPFLEAADAAGLYYGDNLRASTWESFQSQGMAGLAPADRSQVNRLALNDYDQRLVFRSAGLKPLEERQLFLTLQINEKLVYNRFKARNLTLSAIWVPAGGTGFNPRKNIARYSFQVDQVHDPNRIRVEPAVLYYRKGYPKEMRYTVQFKNTERGVVDSARIKLEFSKDFDMSTIRIDSAKCVPKMGTCSGQGAADTSLCIKLEPLELPGRNWLTLSIYAVGLERREKGQVVFTIKTKDRRPRQTRVDGEVLFIGAPKADPLSGARPVWRQKSLRLTLGSPLSQQLRIISTVNAREQEIRFQPAWDHIYDNLSIQLSGQNTPITKSWLSWGYGLGYSHFNLQRNEGNASSVIRIDEGQLNAFAGAQFGNFIRIKAQGGVIFPMTLDISTQDQIEGGARFYHLGMLQKRAQGMNNALPGIQSGLGIEIGDIHTLSGCIMVSTRYFPRLFTQNANIYSGLESLNRSEVNAVGHIYTIEACLQLKLTALGGKKQQGVRP